MDKKGEFPESGCRHTAPSPGNEDSFIERMRFHQSWYRCIVLGLEPGPNPSARGKLYGNMLTEKDGSAGRNFLSDEIFRQAQERFPLSQEDDGTARLYCNLLSSQPMCFNLFGPLKDNKLATSLLRSLPGFPKDAEVTEIRFEYAPDKKKHLKDRTSFDFFAIYNRPGSIRGFVGIETKLSEPFSQKEYEFEEQYSQWMKYKDWWWKPGEEKHFKEIQYNQLWRNHLLCFSMLNQKPPDFNEGYCAVVYPKGDTSCHNAIDKYRAVLLPSGLRTLLAWPLENLVSSWAPLLETETQRKWHKDFQIRYLELELSEPAWKVYQKGVNP